MWLSVEPHCIARLTSMLMLQDGPEPRSANGRNPMTTGGCIVIETQRASDEIWGNEDHDGGFGILLVWVSLQVVSCLPKVPFR